MSILDSPVPEIGQTPLRPTRSTPPQNVSVVRDKMNEWYDWLVSHVPKTVRKKTSTA